MITLLTINQNIIFIFGGLSLFLFSLDQIKFTLNNKFSQKLLNIINTYTNSKFKSFITGCLCATLIQSSSGVTAIAISLLSTKLINEKTCLGIIIGANLGTCVTTFITAININHISLILIILSFLGFLFLNKHKNKFLIPLLIGIMLLGLDILHFGFTSIIENQKIKEFINNNQDSIFLSSLFGVFSTAIIQSSSGIISIVEEMYDSNIINLSCALSIMFGANIGTTFTGYFATINTTKETKLIINLNLLFNVFGVLLFLIIFKPFLNFIYLLQNKYFLSNLKLSIAYAHFFFNLITVLLAYLFFDGFNYFLKKKVDNNKKNDIILS